MGPQATTFLPVPAVFTCIGREFFTGPAAVRLRIRIYSISFGLARRMQHSPHPDHPIEQVQANPTPGGTRYAFN
jgi:hypothetical protein